MGYEIGIFDDAFTIGEDPELADEQVHIISEGTKHFVYVKVLRGHVYLNVVMTLELEPSDNVFREVLKIAGVPD